jgi:hypothetical protein
MQGREYKNHNLQFSKVIFQQTGETTIAWFWWQNTMAQLVGHQYLVGAYLGNRCLSE